MDAATQTSSGLLAFAVSIRHGRLPRVVAPSKLPIILCPSIHPSLRFATMKFPSHSNIYCQTLNMPAGRFDAHRTICHAGQRKHSGLVPGASDGYHNPQLRALQSGGQGGGVCGRHAAHERQHHSGKTGAVGAGLRNNTPSFPSLGGPPAGTLLAGLFNAPLQLTLCL